MVGGYEKKMFSTIFNSVFPRVLGGWFVLQLVIFFITSKILLTL